MGEHRAFFRSPIGTVEVVGTETGLKGLQFVPGEPGGPSESDPVLEAALAQLDEYFLGERRGFSLRLELEGTDFQRRVWRELQKVPFGQTVSYGEVAAALGMPKAARAIGQANHHNPVSIIIPCHRVVGGDGRLVGYGGGLWRKHWLLEHEKKNAPGLEGRGGK